jgi:hypothetical protein
MVSDENSLRCLYRPCFLHICLFTFRKSFCYRNSSSLIIIMFYLGSRYRIKQFLVHVEIRGDEFVYYTIQSPIHFRQVMMINPIYEINKDSENFRYLSNISRARAICHAFLLILSLKSRQA